MTEPRQFNLLFKTRVGPVEDEASVAYLRPETAQAMFVNYRNVQESMRKKLPFGIAQIGRSFRRQRNVEQWREQRGVFSRIKLDLHKSIF